MPTCTQCGKQTAKPVFFVVRVRYAEYTISFCSDSCKTQFELEQSKGEMELIIRDPTDE